MLKFSLLYLLIPLFLISNLQAAGVEYKLKRFDTNFYNRSYSGTIKYKIEKINETENEIKSVTRKPTKNGKYEGYYKIGNPYTVLGQTYYPREDPNYREVGMASWYGKDFHNKKTANGETYDMNDYTAAHRTLPLPCIVKITNLENGKSINVRVNDRGPFTKNRIIDVSKKVATKLDFHSQGTTKVKVEYMKKESEKLLRDYGLK